MAKLPADSDKQQAEVVGIQDEDGYNWGYLFYHVFQSTGMLIRFCSWISVSANICWLTMEDTILCSGEFQREAMLATRMDQVAFLNFERWFRCKYLGSMFYPTYPIQWYFFKGDAAFQAVNRIGLRVVLDVVYNHLAASGPLDENSVLDKVIDFKYAFTLT